VLSREGCRNQIEGPNSVSNTRRTHYEFQGMAFVDPATALVHI
jgi:hypothetical protein